MWVKYKNVSKVTLSGDSSVAVGDKITLKAKVSPKTANPKIKWSSSNENIAKVNSKGIVTGVKAGSVTITATSKETTYGEWTTESAELMSTTLLLGGTIYVPWYEDGQFVQSDYRYEFTDNTIASIDSTTGLITALKTGETYLKLISNYDSTTFKMLKITVIESANASSGSDNSSSQDTDIPVNSITVPQDTIKI